jgi:hypothetical protein
MASNIGVLRVDGVEGVDGVDVGASVGSDTRVPILRFGNPYDTAFADEIVASALGPDRVDAG